MHVVLAVLPWHVLPHANAAAGVLASAVAPEHTADVYYGSLEFAEWMLGEDVDPGDGPDSVLQAPLDPELYHLVAEGGYIAGVAEWVFAAGIRGNPTDDLPDAMEMAERLGLDRNAVRRLRRLAVAFVDHAARQILASDPDVVGFTTTFAQTAACLAVAQRVKESAPHVPLVFGGSNCDGDMGAALHEAFDCVDFVVRREGEKPFRSLLEALAVEAGPTRDASLATIPGLCWRPTSPAAPYGMFGEQRVNAESGALPQGRDFPPIAQGDYLASLDKSPVAEHLSANLVFESSRGCWWGAKQHCTFCGLDDLIMPFRSKPAAQVSTELRELVATHQVLDVVTTDDILEKSYYAELFPGFAVDRPDWRLHYEIKANVTEEMAASMRAAGVLMVQPGIENLHSAPLKLMRKGTTGVANVAALRDLQTQGITVSWNYLVGFPGETDDDYWEVVGQLPRLHHLQAPSGPTRIVLERFNPYFTDPGLGFAEREPMQWYRWVYPNLSDEQRARLAYLFDTEDAGVSDRVVEALRAAIDTWAHEYDGSELTHRLVDGQLWIYERRAGRRAVDLCLDDPVEADAYLALRRGQSPERLARTLREKGCDVSTDWCAGFVHELDAYHLVFTESGRAVTLSLPHDPARRTSHPVLTSRGEQR